MTAQPRDGDVTAALADGRYELGRLLGAGGMGLVHQARDLTLHRDVAIKLLADNLAADPVARERFLREARAAARVVHPNVVTVHDVGSEGERPYLVMELVDGPSLASILRAAGRLPVTDVVEVAIDALAGLEQAHVAGLLHRDVKPGNLLRGSDGTVKVTDFGVAEAADVPGLTNTGTVLGTLPYLAPERRRGDSATVRTDLFALGVTLAELATGRPAQPDATIVVDGEGADGLVGLVHALVRSDPDSRPSDAGEALAILAGDRPVPRGRGPAGHGGTVRSSTVELPSDGPSSSDTTRASAPLDVTGTTQDLPAVVPTASPSRGRRPARLAVAVALVVVLAVASWLARPDDTGGTPAAPDDGAERVDGDGAATMRNLADWLRSQGGG